MPAPGGGGGGAATVSGVTSSLSISGQAGDYGIGQNDKNTQTGGKGGSTIYGSGGASVSVIPSNDLAGVNGTGYGAGGSGGVSYANASGVSGGTGAGGVIIIYEYK